LNGAFVLRPDTDFRVPLPIGPLSIYALRENWQGHDIGQQEWRDVTEACRTGSILLRVPPGRTVVLYAVDDRPLEPRAFDKSQDRIAAQMREVMPGFSPRAHLYRIAIGVSSSRTAAVLMALGGIPSRVVARMLPPASGRDRATLFSIDTAGLLRTPDQRSELLVMARDEQSQLTGDGWSSVDFDVVGPYRWMTAPESALVMPIAAPGPTHVRVQALRRPGTGGPTTMGLRINGTTLPAQPIQSGWHAYEWRVPETLTHQGPNEMAIVVDRLPDGKAVAVSDVRLERRP
jgi:hypothetical protein